MKYRIFIFYLFLNSTLIGQEQTGIHSKHKFGFSYSYGSQMFLNVDYEYKVSLYQFHYLRRLVDKKTWGIDLLINPHYGTNSYYATNEYILDLRGYEYGTNIGGLFRKNISKNHIIGYVILSLGIHFVSGVPKRQSSGFLFSDNVSVGTLIKLHHELYLQIGFGIRHISNAQTRYPNGGINTTVLTTGIIFSPK